MRAPGGQSQFAKNVWSKSKGLKLANASCKWLHAKLFRVPQLLILLLCCFMFHWRLQVAASPGLPSHPPQGILRNFRLGEVWAKTVVAIMFELQSPKNSKGKELKKTLSTCNAAKGLQVCLKSKVYLGNSQNRFTCSTKTCFKKDGEKTERT